MEEHARESCSVVYYCAGAGRDGDVYELFHKQSPPAESGDEAAALGNVHHNVRALLDEDQGGFDEVFVCSRPDQCLERLETYANSAPTLVLIELHPTSDPATDSSDLTFNKKAAPFSFLEALGTDVQGSRFQQPVLPFVLYDIDNPDDSDAALDMTLTTDCLTAGAIDTVRSPLKHEDINHLIGHLKEKVRPPARLIGSQMAQNLVNSIHDASTPRVAYHRPDLQLPQHRKDAVEIAVKKWRFPASQFNMDELSYAAMFMLEHLLQSPELEAYALPRDRLMSFILATRRQYKHEREVHYHNWRHAVDVTQSIYCILLDMRLCPNSVTEDRPYKELNAVEQMLTHLDALILIVSAIGHDVGHPGVNNAFLVAVNHPLAQAYNDKSVLENYHCAAYSQLLRRHWPELHNIPSFRTTMISTILATDMQRHFEYMKSLADLKASTASTDVNGWSEKDREHTRELIMALLMKAADISNVARPFEVSASWAKILMNEFARQGELESELSIPTCLFGGPPDTEDILAQAKSQKGFMSLFGIPLFQGISTALPSILCSVRELERNRDIWDQKIQEETSRRTPVGNEGHLTFSSVTKDEVEQATSHRKSEPFPLPTDGSPSKQLERPATVNTETSPSKQTTDTLRQQIVQGMAMNDEKRTSMPFLASPGIPLSPLAGSSRRSSKDVALENMQQMNPYVQPSLSPTPGSRRESADAGWQIHQSYPSSRRGSKDESLTTILVTSGGTPNRRSSPSSAPAATSPGKYATKRQSLPQSQKQAARNAASTSRSHNPSIGTATTTQPSFSNPASTQPSSEEDETAFKSHASAPSTEDPFGVPGTWANGFDGQHRATHSQHSPDINPSTPPPLAMTKSDSTSRVLTTSVSGDDESRGSPRKDADSGMRGSRSRSRLRSLKFWKKRKEAVATSDTTGVSADDLMGASP